MTQLKLGAKPDALAAEEGLDPNLVADITRPDEIGVLCVGADGNVVDCCRGAERMFGAPREELVGKRAMGFFHRAAPVERPFSLDVAERPAAVQCIAHAPDGRVFPVMITVFALNAACPQMRCCVVSDLTHLSSQLKQLQRLTAAVDQTGDAVAVTDASGIVEYVNAAFEKVTGYARQDVIGRTMAFMKSDLHPPSFYAGLWNTLQSGNVFRARFANRRKDGRVFYEEKTISPIRNRDGRIISFVSTAKDVTDQVDIENRLDRLANYDTLTGLPNRNLFMDRIRRAVASCARNGKALALLYLDLDRFKLINDTFGHAAGDELLRLAADRLSACVREVDTVSRLGGDEFTVVLADIESDGDTRRVVDAILAAFALPFPIEGRQVYVSTSIGISVFRSGECDAATLLKEADLAMYHAKAAGRNGYAFFEPGMDESVKDSLALETDLRGALGRGELSLAYQPQVDLNTGRIVAVEALLRWTHPERGAIPPVRFIPLMEEMGLMGPVSEWVISTACADVKRLGELTGIELQVAVNLSSGQFKDPRLIDQIACALARTGLDPRRLEVEITEGTLMESVPATVNTLESLARSGARIAVDDFGTGYSSLSYLRRFSVDTIKIDRSFIWDTPHDPDATAIVKAIISLGRDLEMKVVAEGIETAEQFQYLQSLGCERAQGFLFSKPVTLDVLGAKLREMVDLAVK